MFKSCSRQEFVPLNNKLKLANGQSECKIFINLQHMLHYMLNYNSVFLSENCIPSEKGFFKLKGRRRVGREIDG